MTVKFAKHRGHRPYEHPGVPTKIPPADKRVRQIRIWFFTKTHDAMNCVVVGTFAQTYRLAVLYITESGTRPCRFDADGDKLACLVSRISGKRKCFLKRCAICNDVIGGQDNHRGCMIPQRY